MAAASASASVAAAAAAVQTSSRINRHSSAHETPALCAAKITSPAARFPRKLGTAFAAGSPLRLVIGGPIYRRNCEHKPRSVGIRCEKSSKQIKRAAAVWLGRLAMVGFASTITVEIITGKGLLENIGVGTPLPTVALAVTLLVGVLAAVFIFQSASDN